ncbi:MAG: deoxynucleoside kinase [Catalinimonas sp.]
MAGNIGVGKTTLTHLLAEAYGWTPHEEATRRNPYLEDFYDDMPRWSFPLQIYFLNSRFRQALDVATAGRGVVQDRTIYEDAHIFARNLRESKLMSARDHATYLGLYDSMRSLVRPPDLLIYLQAGLPRLKEGIRRRGRAYERSIPDVYLANLNELYERWITGYDAGPLLVINADERDLLKRAEDRGWLHGRIFDHLSVRPGAGVVTPSGPDVSR